MLTNLLQFFVSQNSGSWNGNRGGVNFNLKNGVLNPKDAVCYLKYVVTQLQRCGCLTIRCGSKRQSWGLQPQ
jgi:hypothetical protein